MDKKWDMRFLEMAELVASWSKDPSTQVGAVIVRPETRVVVGVGYNGFPRGVPDSEEHYNDRKEKYPRVVHAEANAILSASSSVRGCHIYVTRLLPCADCAGFIIQSGIKEVITDCSGDAYRWAEQHNIAMDMFGHSGVTVRRI